MPTYATLRGFVNDLAFYSPVFGVFCNVTDTLISFVAVYFHILCKMLSSSYQFDMCREL